MLDWEHIFATRSSRMRASEIRELLKLLDRPDIISFAGGIPDPALFPDAEFKDAYAEIFAGPAVGAALQYSVSEGYKPLREWLAGWQKVSADRVLTGNGSLQLIEFLCLEMIQPGDVVFTESPTYDRTLGLLRRHEATIVGIQLEPDGPNIDALESALAKRVPKFFYVIPDFQNPAGTTCSAASHSTSRPSASNPGAAVVRARYEPGGRVVPTSAARRADQGIVGRAAEGRG